MLLFSNSFVALLVIFLASLTFPIAAKYFGYGAFLKVDQNNIPRHWWQTAENRLSLQFSFCNPDGVLLYQTNKSSDQDFFSLFIYQQFIFYEWHSGSKVKEVA